MIGFLIRKTVQPHSQRTDHSNFNDYRNSNIIVYLNKKIGDIRIRNGQTQLPRSVFTSTNLQMKPKARSDEKKKEPFTNYQVDKNVQIIVGKIQKPQFQDDFFIETKGSNKRPKVASHKTVGVETKLRVLMNENIEEKELESMFKFYKQQNLRATLNQIKTQMKDPLFQQKFQERVVKNGLRQVEFDDKDQVNFFMNKVCEQNKDKSTAGKVLKVNEEHIVYRKVIHDEFEAMKQIVQKRITNEKLEKVIKASEEDQQKDLVRIFRETRPDYSRFDPDFFKNKIKMTTMKKLNEAQEKQYQNFFTTPTESTKSLSSQRFSRYPKTYNAKYRKTKSKINSLNIKIPHEATQDFDDLKTRAGSEMIGGPQQRLNLASIHEDATPISKGRSATTYFKRVQSSAPKSSPMNLFDSERLLLLQKKIDPEVIENMIEVRQLQIKAGSLVEECTQAEIKILKDKQVLLSKIDNLEEDVLKTFSVVDLMEQLQNQDGRIAIHKEFDKFLNERKFKKKFVDYLIDHVEKKSDLLSQITIEKSSKMQIAQLLPSEEKFF